MFFTNFPQITYDFNAIGVQNMEILNLLARVRFLFNSVESNRTYTTYSIRHGDTPDIIAHQHYGSSDWWWLVLLFNDIIDPFSDIPRLGFDKNHAQTGNYLYLERTDGISFRDFQDGDILLKAEKDASKLLVITEDEPQSLKQQKSLGMNNKIRGPKIILDSTGTDTNEQRASGRIENWRAEFREAKVKDVYEGSFAKGDFVAVVEKVKGVARPVVWGEIIKIGSWGTAISKVIDNKSGRQVSPMLDVQTGKVLSYTSLTERNKVKGDITNATANSILSGALGFSGGGGSTYGERYTLPTNDEAPADSNVKHRIKLLDDSYKYEALSLLSQLLSQSGTGYAEYTKEGTIIRSGRTVVPVGPSIEGPTRIY